MTRTGKFASKEQIDSMRSAMSAPYILGSGGVAPRSAVELAHEYALASGLPEVPGFYGCDLTNGEFVSA